MEGIKFNFYHEMKLGCLRYRTPWVFLIRFPGEWNSSDYFENNNNNTGYWRMCVNHLNGFDRWELELSVYWIICVLRNFEFGVVRKHWFAAHTFFASAQNSQSGSARIIRYWHIPPGSVLRCMVFAHVAKVRHGRAAPLLVALHYDSQCWGWSGTFLRIINQHHGQCP